MRIPQVQTQDRFLNQIQQNIASQIEPIFNALSGQFVVSLTGCTTVPSGIAKWQRSTSTGQVTILFPALTGTSNTASAALTGLPVALWPISQQVCFVRVSNNSNFVTSVIAIEPDGTLILFSAIDSATFVTSGTKGIYISTVTYEVAL